MREYKLIKLLEHFSNTELKQFESFCSSQNGEKHKLTLLLKSIQDSLKRKESEQEYIVAFLLKKHQIDIKILRKLFHELLEVAKDFIVIQQIKNESFIHNYYFLLYVEEKELYNEFKKDFEDAQLALNKLPKIDTKDLWFDYSFNVFQNNIDVNHNIIEGNRKIQNQIDALDRYILFAKLVDLCNALSHSKVFSNTLVITWADTFIQLAENDIRFQKDKLIQPFLAAVKLLLTNEEVYFEKMLNAIVDEENCLHDQLLRLMITVAENFAAWKINNGFNYTKEVHLLHVTRIKSNTLVNKNNLISPGVFLNAVTAALQLNKTDFVRQFIKEQSPKLEQSVRKDIAAFCQCKILLVEKKYGETIQLLNKTTFTDLFYQVGGRRMILQCFYELNEMSALDSALHALKVFVNRKKEVAPSSAESNNNFLNILSAITKLNKGDKEKAQKLLEQTQQTKAIADRKWLIEKIQKFL
ncbi:MAG: hypothetical protein JNL95_08670 [Chitinophagales bacterium]|nr:hypothetical protein [Chitinophagales bacterium]